MEVFCWNDFLGKSWYVLQTMKISLGSGPCASVEEQKEPTSITVMTGDCRGSVQWNFDVHKNKIKYDVHIIIPKYHFFMKNDIGSCF